MRQGLKRDTAGSDLYRSSVIPPSPARKLASRSDAIHPVLRSEESEAVRYRWDSHHFSGKADFSENADRIPNPYGSDGNSFVRGGEGGEALFVVSLASIFLFRQQSRWPIGWPNRVVAVVELRRELGPSGLFGEGPRSTARRIRCRRVALPGFQRGIFQLRSRRLADRQIERAPDFRREVFESLVPEFLRAKGFWQRCLARRERRRSKEP